MNHNEIFTLLKKLKAQGVRLRAENGELKASSEKGALSPETVVLIKTNKTHLLHYLSKGQEANQITPSPALRYEAFELNENQQAYWLGRSRSVEGGGVAIHLYFEVDATDLNIEQLQTAWQAMIQRHDMLRAVVTPEGQQKVLKRVDVPPFTKICADDNFDQHLAQSRERLSHANYDLTQWPQHEFAVVASRDKKTLCLSLDCWCIDGWSYQILFQEWLQLYRGQSALASLELTFRDYCSHVEGEINQPQISYIEQCAQQLPPAPRIPEKHQNSATPRFKRYQQWLTESQTAALKGWCSKQGVTLASTLLTLYAEVLHLWSSNDRFTVNVPRFNRNADDARIHQVIGEFATFSLVGFDFGAEMDLCHRIKQAQQSVLESMEAGVSGVEILRKRNALTDSVQTMPFVFTNAPEWVTPSGEKQSFIDTLQQFGTLEYAISQTPQVKIDCQYHESREGLYIFWDVREDQFFPEQIQQMFSRFIHSVTELCAAPNAAPLSASVPPKPLNQNLALLEGDVWNEFAQTVALYPNQRAIACEQGERSWSELAMQVSAIAHQIASKQLASNQPIMIIAEKGWQQMAAFLAIHQQGHIAVPADVSNPISRLQFIAEDTQSPLVICSTLHHKLATQTGVTTLEIAEVKEAKAMPARQDMPETMLIIYTSGSTGQPKGVKIATVAMHNAVNATLERFQFGQNDVYFALTQLHHDMAWFDLLASVKTGGTLVYPASQHYRDPQRWIQQMAQYGVTCWNSVPQLMQMLLAALKQSPSELPNVRVAFLGGDWIPLSTHADMKSTLPNARLVSVGGPTETTLWNIMYEVTTFDDTWSSVPYGQPIENNAYRILDQHGRDCPIWVEGELCCSGVGVTSGYVNRPELENEKFFIGEDGQRYYRTGDIGRYRADGNIEFIGRQDDQIMVGGYRIESQEIHRALEDTPSIKQAQVMVEDNQLQAYLVVEQGQTPSVEQLNTLLEGTLPVQMIPSLYFILDAIPLTANGKVDKSALKATRNEPIVKSGQAKERISKPEHIAVANLWEQVLGRAPQTPSDDFFLLGGHSLAAVELFAHMFPHGHQQHSVVSLFELRTVEQQASLLSGQVDQGALVLSQESLDGAELSQGQKRICFVEQMTHQPNLFNLPFRIALSQSCDIEKLHSSLEATLAQFDVFQSKLVNGRWVRTTERPSVLVDTSSCDEETMRHLSREQAREKLDLTTGSGWKAALIKHSDGHYELLMTVHHALFDGWSLQLVLKAWQDKYRGLGQTEPKGSDYFNYCQWESLVQKEPEKDIAYWRGQLEGYQESALLPTQLVPQYHDYSAATQSLDLNLETVQAIRTFSEVHGSTEFAVMMAGFQLLVSRYLSQDDVVIGTHVANRPTPQIQSIPGLFLNNLAIRLRLQANWRVDQLINEQTQTLLCAMKHAALPFERVVSEVDAKGDSRRHPLYQVSFVLDNSKSLEGELGCVVKPTEQAALSTDLEMNIQLNEGTGRINLLYRTGLFTDWSMRQLVEQYQSVINQMLANPSQLLKELSYNVKPKDAVLEGKTVPLPSSSVLSFWQKVVEAKAHTVAYQDEEGTSTFAQLDARAENLAKALTAIGIKKQSRVGVHLGLGEEWLVSLLALVKLSACYVPLATDLPHGRLRQMVEISECALVLSESEMDFGVPCAAPAHVSKVAHLGDTRTEKAFLYITFTSGSTGTPKAVGAIEESTLNRLAWTWKQMPYGENEVCALKTSISFVDSIAEVLAPILQGTPLALIPTESQCDPESFANSIKKQGITRLVMVPSLMETLVEHSQQNQEILPCYRSLSIVVLSGETLSLALAERIQATWPRLQLWNVYGSAEVAADVLAKRIDLHHPKVTLGKPLFNTRIVLQDNWGGLTPSGGKGELMISGKQVISGYLGEQAFPHDEQGEAKFASGDMGQLHASEAAPELTEMTFVGREQQLVKIRGQKVSLAEVRETLAAHKEVRQLAVVMVDEQRIGVMYTPNTLSIQSLQSVAEQYLPRYMRPQVWQGADCMPLLATGKVDLKAVAETLTQQPQRLNDARELTEREEEIAQLWHALTGVYPSDPESHFFDFGGHSLLVNSLTNSLNQTFGLSLRLGLVYDALVLSEMAELIDTLVKTPLVQPSMKETGVI